MTDTKAPAPPALDAGFVARAIFVLGVVALGLLAVELVNLILLVFGAVVVAVLLRAMADPLCARTRISGKAAVGLSALVVLALIGLVGWLFGREIAEQAVSLSETLPQAWATVQARLEATALGSRLLEGLQDASGQASRALALAPKFAIGLMSALTNLVLVVVAGVMLALEPRLYREGLVRLLPKSQRPRLREALDATGASLKLWLGGQLISMSLIGLLTGIGLWIVGVPSPLALGLLAGLAQFVPLLGPILSSIPGLLLAATDGGQTLLWTLAVYVGVQQVESNLVTPLVQRRMVSLPLAVTLFAVVGFGMLVGPLGVLFATPLAVAVYVLVKVLYLRDVLGDEVELPGAAAKEAKGGKADDG